MTPLYHPLRNLIVKKKQKKELIEWRKCERTVPIPHLLKQRILKAYARKFKIKIFIESGTYYGDMVEAMKDDFDLIYSIEISEELYKEASKRFKKEENIEIIQGDSGIELLKIINKITQPTLFWLDGHYSAGLTARGDKDTPILEEFDYIFNAEERGHVIIIDDARCFGTDPAYPSIEELSNFIFTKRPDTNIDIPDDCIRITQNR